MNIDNIYKKVEFEKANTKKIMTEAVNNFLVLIERDICEAIKNKETYVNIDKSIQPKLMALFKLLSIYKLETLKPIFLDFGFTIIVVQAYLTHYYKISWVKPENIDNI